MKTFLQFRSEPLRSRGRPRWFRLAMLAAAVLAAINPCLGAQGVAVKIYAQAYGWSGSLSLNGTFLPSSPTANDGYAEANASPVSNGTATAILGTREYVRLEPGKSYTLSVRSSGLDSGAVNVLAPPGYQVVMDQMIRSRETFGSSATMVIQLLSLGARHPGLAGMASSVASNEIEWRVSLGSLRNGGSAGELALIDTGTRTEWGPICTPGSLYYEAVSNEISVYRPANILRQILANQVAVDIVTLTTTSFEIRCYHPTQVQGTTFPRTFTGQAYLTYRVEQGTTAMSLKFIKEVRNVTDATATNLAVSRREIMKLDRTADTWPAATWTRSDWTLEGANALSETYVVSDGAPAARTEAITVRAPSTGKVALAVTRNYEVPTNNNISLIGEVLAKETLGTSDGLESSFDYYTDSTKFGSLGYVKSAKLPGKNWVAYDYYDADLAVGYRGGRMKYVYRPYLDAPTEITRDVSQGEVTYYEYVNDLFGAPTRSSLVQTTVNGTLTGKTTISYDDSYGTANGFPLGQSTRAEYAAAVRSLSTVIRYYREDVSDAFIRGQTYSITAPDGVKQSFGYQRGTWDGTTFTPDAGQVGMGTASRIMVVNGSAYATAGSSCPNQDSYQFDTVYLVDGKSTKEVTIRNSRALVARTESHVWKNSAWQRVSYTDYAYDFAGRLTSRVGSNGTTYQAGYAGDLKDSETDEAGVQTGYLYDVMGRIDVKTRAGFGSIATLATKFGYDAAGRVLTETVGSGEETIVTSRQYDDAGRVRTETPAGLAPTTHSYDVDNHSHTITRPAGAGVTTEKTYLDGRARSTTGSGVVATYHTYGVETDGRRWTQVNSGSLTSPRWSKAWSDWLGRSTRTEAPGFQGAANVFQENFYEIGTGRLFSTTKAGYAATLYEYDPLGKVKRSGLDVNGTGVLDLASSDRISETDTYLESYNGAWWTRMDTKTYPKLGLDTVIVTATSRTRLTGLPATRLSETQSVDAEGNVTVQVVDVDRAARTSIATTTRTGFPNPQVETTVNGFSTSIIGFDGLETTTAFDALLRRWTVTDSRDNTTTTTYYSGTTLPFTVAHPTGATADTTVHVSAMHYDGAGRVDWQSENWKGLPPAASDHFTYYAYNPRGQVLRQWGDGTTPVSYDYGDDDPSYPIKYGERVKMSTYRGGSGFDAGTWPAQPGDADTTTWTYDEPSGLLWKKTDAPVFPATVGKTVTQTYNVRGQTWIRTLARGVTTTYGYDDATGELLSQSYRDGTPTVSYTYGRSGQVETITDVTGTRDLIYDPNKPWRLTAEAEDGFYGNRVVTRLYDENVVLGRVRGLQLGPVFGSSAELEQTFGFTTVGRFETLTTKRDANASSRTFRYTWRPDAALIQALSIDGDTSFSVVRNYEDHRDLVTRLNTLWGATSQTRYDYVYDELGNRKSAMQSGDVFDYGDATFRLYAYNHRGEVTGDVGYLGSTVTDQTKPLKGRRHTFDYDNAGNRKWSDRNGTDDNHDGVLDLRDDYKVNELNQYTQRTNNTLPVSGTATSLAGAGPTVVLAQGRTEVAGRQGSYWNDELTVPNYSHAWRGPVTFFTATPASGGSPGTYRVDSRMAELAAMWQDFEYDADGNLTKDGIAVYQWDAENRLIGITTNQDAVGWGFAYRAITFRYDYMGRRVLKRVYDISQNQEISCRRFLYDGWNLLAEYGATGDAATGSIVNLLRSYTWGLDIARSLTDAGGVGALLQIADHPTGKTYLPTYDGNGNIVSLLNASSGAIAAIYEYGPFGETLRAQTNDPTVADQPFRFSTKWTDLETNLIYYGKRYYSSSLGRFINRDPIEEAGGLNLYGFCGNNGVNRWDVLGNEYDPKKPMGPDNFLPLPADYACKYWAPPLGLDASNEFLPGAEDRYQMNNEWGNLWGNPTFDQPTTTVGSSVASTAGMTFENFTGPGGNAPTASQVVADAELTFGGGGLNATGPDGVRFVDASLTQPPRDWADRASQLSRGIASTAGSVILFSAAAAVEVGSSGLATVGAVFLGVNGAAALSYGLGNIVGAFANSTDAKKMVSSPATLPQGIGRLVDGERGQGAVQLVEVWVAMPSAANNGGIEMVKNFVEVIDATTDANEKGGAKGSPNSGPQH